MLVCKVLVTDYCVGNSSKTSPSSKPDGIEQYDMMVDDLQNPSIFVVTRDYHAVPAYSITFKRRSVRSLRLSD